MSATQAGLRLVPTSVGAALGGIACGIVMRASGTYYILNLVIQALFLIPLGLTMRLKLDSPVWYPIVYFFFTGFACAGKLTVTVTALIAAVEQKNHAVVTSASYAFRGTGSTIGISICSLVFQNILKQRLWERFGTQGLGGFDREIKRQSDRDQVSGCQPGKTSTGSVHGCAESSICNNIWPGSLGHSGKFVHEGVYTA